VKECLYSIWLASTCSI